MALRARLVPPPPQRESWPWHQVQTGSLSVSLLVKGDRRMEAESFLASGFGHRLAIKSHKSGWTALSQIARAWQPSRLKGIIVSPEFGTPFLAATQVFDVRPVPRKWLSLDRTDQAADRFTAKGTILLTCSGSVGRATLAHAPHDDILISHDLLRIRPHNLKDRGWVYAYLRAPAVREMMQAAQYGHMIKHLETQHLDEMPIVEIDAGVSSYFERATRRILRYRDLAHLNQLKAEAMFEEAVGAAPPPASLSAGFSVGLSALSGGRRRLDATYYAPEVSQLRGHMRAGGRVTSELGALGFQAWLPNRFKRVPAQDGVDLVGSSALFEINPDSIKKIAEVDFGDPYSGRVKTGWMLISRSGQTYGLLGSLAMASAFHENKVVSDDVIRLAPGPGCKIPVGFVYTALSHPTLGRPVMKGLAYGSSIPHIEVADLLRVEIPRVDEKLERQIAARAMKATKLRADADALENLIAAQADEMVRSFAASGKVSVPLALQRFVNKVTA